MARYGRIYRGRSRGRGYAGGYGEYRPSREWRTGPPYGRDFGPPGEYGGEPAYEAYDFGYGGRGWPYERGYGDEWRGGWPTGRRERERGARWRPGGYGYGRRRLRRRRRPRPMWPPYRPYGAEFEGGMAYGYGRDYGRRERIGRYAGRTYARREEPRYGFTPSSRWPEDGHDLDHPHPLERGMTEDEIRDAVLENLFQDSFVDPRDIEVDVTDDVVTLRGEVSDYMEARYAWDDAWESAGVRGVINNLTVRTDRPSEAMDLPQTAGRRRGGRKHTRERRPAAPSD